MAAEEGLVADDEEVKALTVQNEIAYMKRKAEIEATEALSAEA